MTHSAWPPETWETQAPEPAPRPRKDSRGGDGGKENAGGKVVLVLVLVLALLVGGAYAAAHLLAKDRVPHGTTIAGVDVGGHTRSEAEQLLAAGLAPRLQRPIPVSIGGVQRTISPGVAGLGVDLAGSVAAADGGSSWSATRLWRYYTDGPRLDAVLSLDPGAMATALHGLAARVDKPAVDGGVSFTSAGVEITRPVVGRSVDVAAAQRALVAAFAAQVSGSPAAAPVVLPTKAVDPDIDANDVQTAVSDFANPATSGPVTLDFLHGSVRLATRDLLPLLSMEPRGGSLVPVVDPQLLQNLIDPSLLVGEDPVDAGVALVGGAPAVVRAVPGTTYTPADVAATVIGLLRQRDSREGPVRTTRVPAPFTNADAAELGVTDPIASISLSAPPGLDLGPAASAIDETLLKPGESLSTANLVGGLTLSAQARIQLASTLYEAGLTAGMTVLERHGPLVYFPRFAMGQDAIVGPGQDLRLRNISRYGELVTADGSAGHLSITIWSHRAYDVSLAAGAPYDVVPPLSVVDTSTPCTPQVGRNGFAVDVTRSFRRHGRDRVFATDTTTTTYQPVQGVRCRPAPPVTPPPVTPPPVTPPPAAAG